MNELQNSLTQVTAQIAGARLRRIVKEIREDGAQEASETETWHDNPHQLRSDDSYATEIVDVMDLIHAAAQEIGHLGDAG